MKKVVKKIIKISSITILSLVILTSGGLAFLRYFFSEDKIKEIIVSETEKFLNKRISIEDLHYGFGGVILREITMYDGLDIDSPVLFKAGDINLGFSILDLINRDLNIKDITISDLELQVVFDAENKTNLAKIINNRAPSKGQGTIKADVSKIKLKNARLSIIDPKDAFAPLGGEYIITTNLDFSKEKIINFEDCILTLPETRGTLTPDISITIENDTVTISGDVGLKQISLLWVYKWTKNKTNMLPYNIVNGNVKNLQITIAPERRIIIEGNVKATCTLVNYPYTVNADGFCRVNVFDETVLISDVNAQIDSSNVLLAKLLFGFNGHLASLEAKNASANITHLTALLPLIPSKVSGHVSGNLFYAAEKFTGTLALSNVGFNAKSDLISGINTTVTINDNQIRETGIAVNFMGNPCTASIATTNNSLKNLFVDLKGDKFIIKQTSELKQGTVAAGTALNNVEKASIPVVINGRIDFGSIQYDKFTFGATSINYSMSGNTLSVPRLSTSFLKGTINAEGNISLAGTDPIASLRLFFNNIALQDLSSLNPDFKNRIYGLLSGRGNMSFALSRRLLSSAKGNVVFQIASGKIVNTGIQNGLGIWLSELKYKLTDLEFNTINGEIEVANNNYIINNFLFNSENIRLRLQGTINDEFEANNMDISLAFTPRFIQDVPTIALGLQNRKVDNWYTIPFIGNGKITEGKNIKMAK